INKMSSIGQEMRAPLEFLMACLVESPRRSHGASLVWNAVQLGIVVSLSDSGEQNDAILAPSSTVEPFHPIQVAECYWQSASSRINLLNPGFCVKCHEPTIRRPEGRGSVFSSGQSVGQSGVQRTKPKAPLAV